MPFSHLLYGIDQLSECVSYGFGVGGSKDWLPCLEFGHHVTVTKVQVNFGWRVLSCHTSVLTYLPEDRCMSVASTLRILPKSPAEPCFLYTSLDIVCRAA